MAVKSSMSYNLARLRAFAAMRALDGSAPWLFFFYNPEPESLLQLAMTSFPLSLFRIGGSANTFSLLFKIPLNVDSAIFIFLANFILDIFDVSKSFMSLTLSKIDKLLLDDGMMKLCYSCVKSETKLMTIYCVILF